MVVTNRRSAARAFVSCLLAILPALAAGCVGSDGMVWSPDGTRGAISTCRVAEDGSGAGAGRICDSKGAVEADLGSTAGTFAWSADGDDLYFARVDGTPNVLDADRRWLGSRAKPSTAPATGTGESLVFSTLCRWRAGKAEAIAPLGARRVMSIAVSPDGTWAVVVVAAEHNPDAQAGDQVDMSVWAVDLGSKRAFTLADHAGANVCFTGPHRVAFIDTVGHTDLYQPHGSLVEVVLDANATGSLPRTTISDERCMGWASLASRDGGATIYFACERTDTRLPVESHAVKNFDGILCRWDRGTARLTRLSEHLACPFAVSPDGARIVFFEFGGPDDPGRSSTLAPASLVLADTNGEHRHVLRTRVNLLELPLPPTWHGNDRLTMSTEAGERIAPVPPNTRWRLRYEVVDYQLDHDGKLTEDNMLSRGWPAELKPRSAVDEGYRP